MFEIIKNFEQLAAVTSGTANTPTRMSATSKPFRRVEVTTAAGNSAAVVIGPNSTPTYYSLPANDTYVIEAPLGYQFDLMEWYFTSTAVSQNVRLLCI